MKSKMIRMFKKMDDVTIAIVSTIMVMLGFAEGYLISTLISSCHVERVKAKLQDAIDNKFEVDKKVDELKKKVQELEDINNSIRSILDGNKSLPPPPWRLCREDSSDSEPDSPLSMVSSITSQSNKD